MELSVAVVLRFGGREASGTTDQMHSPTTLKHLCGQLVTSLTTVLYDKAALCNITTHVTSTQNDFLA